MCLVRGAQAEWDAAVGCLAVSISPFRALESAIHDAASNTPCFDKLTDLTGMCLVRGDLS